MDKWKNRWPVAGPTRLVLAVALVLFLSTGLLLLPEAPRDDDGHKSTEGRQKQQQQQQQQWLLFEPKWPEPEEPETSLPPAEVAANSSGGTKKQSFINERDLGPQSNLQLASSNAEQQETSRHWRPLRDEPRIASHRRVRRFSRTERKPILNEFSFPANLVQGMRFVLMCQVLDGESPIQIKWFKDNEELMTAPDSSVVLLQPQGNKLAAPEQQVELVTNDELGASLLFRRVQQQHGGNYTCLAANQHGSSSFSSFMSVKVPPSWKVEPQDQHSIMGDQITIDCQATGNPNPFIRWKFASIQQQQQHAANQLVASSDTSLGQVNSDSSGQTQPTNFKLINSNHHVQTLENGSLSIRQTQKEHEGFYLCEADNGVEPNLVKALRLVVHLQAQFADELQLIEPASQLAAASAQQQQQASSTSLAPGAAKAARLALGASQMRILCQPLGDPPLTLEWLKDGQPIYTHTTPADLSLLAPTANKQHQWLNSNAAASASGPSNNTTTNHLPASSSSHHVSTRRSLQRPLVGLESELVVTNIRRQDAGLYTCLARNAYGQAQSRLRLVVQEPPEPPELVDVGHIGSRSIGLRWLAPFDGNSPIVKYTIEYRRQPGPPDSFIETNSADQPPAVYGSQSDKLMLPKSAEVQNVAGSLQQATMNSAHPLPSQQQGQQQHQVQHTIHELEPLTSYSVRVVAVNAIGKSRPSVALSLRTDEEVPSVVPGLVEAIVLSSKSIKLRWSISYSPAHEIIDGFFVGYRSLEPAQPPASSPLAHPSLANGPAEQPTFTYKTIRLTNQQQQQPISNNQPSDGQQRQFELDTGSGGQSSSDSPSAFLSPISSITKSLPVAAANPFAVGHQSAASGGLPVAQQPQQVVVVSAFEYVINGLDRNTEYSILIQCFNRKGAGPTSDPVVFKTFINDPPEKLALSTDEIKESSLRLSWRFVGAGDRLATASGSPRSQEPVDGFVLTFAKVASQGKVTGNGRNQQQRQMGALIEPVAESSKRALGQPAARISNQPPPVDQWQAIQLAPQQRSHQLKKLECGTSYVMKIWAFNKIGNGDPSDPITVRTQGKAPIAPEKRAFISANSTQLRLHLSAWYDGGCEIDKFVVQYRIRGQQEWLLLSNNILRDQASVTVRDLLPATGYEILVAAHNQVATTEARYRVVTLDADGKPVSHSFLGNLPSLEDFEDEQAPVDYTDADGIRRWPQATPTSRSLAILRNLMNSPLALILSLCLCVVIVMVILLYRFQSISSPSNTSSLNSNKSSGSSSGGGVGRLGSCDATTIMLSNSERGPMSLANDSPGDSPQIGAFPTGQRLHGFIQPPDCQYQSFCGPAAGQGRQQQSSGEYGRSCMQDNVAAYPPVGSSYETHPGSANYPVGQYTGVQPMEPNESDVLGLRTDNSDQRQQQCLMQMLMMGSQQKQQQQQVDAGSYVAALTTMARGGKNNSKQFGQHLVQSNSSSYVTQAFSSANTLGRHPAVDYQRLQQQQQHHHQQQQLQQVAGFPGKQLLLNSVADLTSNLIEANHHQSNNFSMASNMQQTNDRDDRASDELYSMSTFAQPSTDQTIGAHSAHSMDSGRSITQTTYCGSNSTTTSSSGCGIATNSSGGSDGAEPIGLNTLRQQNVVTLNQTDQQMNPATSLFDTDKSIMSLGKQTSSGNNVSSLQLPDNDIIGTSSDRENRDKPISQYDVPYKFTNHVASNHISADLDKKNPEFGNNICY